MRVKSVLKNSLTALISQLVLFVLGMVNRKIFITYLGVELLGLDGLFANLFSVLSLAELGIGGMISYHLYQAVAQGDEAKIRTLAAVHRSAYRVIGVFVVVCGAVLFPVLPLIVQKATMDWGYIRAVYLFNLAAAAGGYFLSYRRVLYIAHQREYVCAAADLTVNLIGQVLQLGILVLCRSYLLYMAVSVARTMAANLVLYLKCRKDYPYLKMKTRIGWEDVTRLRLLSDMKNYMVHKLASIVYFGTDQIIISITLGVSAVGLYSNYLMIQNQVTGMVLYKVLSPLKASIGNLVYSDAEPERQKEIFWGLSLFGFLLASFAATSFLVLFQPFIGLFFGRDCLLPLSFAAAMSLWAYLTWNGELLYFYRSAFGRFEVDRVYMVLSAACNLVLSAVLSWIWGITGIIVGTVAGMLLIWAGRIRFVFSAYMKGETAAYMKKQAVYFLLFLAEASCTYLVSLALPDTFAGLFLRAGLCLILPNGVNFCLLRRRPDFQMIKKYAAMVLLSAKEILTRRKDS